MAPKLHSQRGRVRANGNGWHAWMQINRKDYVGPQRDEKVNADQDLEAMRNVAPENVAQLVTELKDAARKVKLEQLAHDDRIGNDGIGNAMP